MNDRDFFEICKSDAVFADLRRYTEDRGTFICRYTGVQLHYVHPYILNTQGQSLLFQDVFDVNKNKHVGDYMWCNNNRSWAKMNLQPGDIVKFECGATMLRYGREYHTNNYYRPIRNLFRLVYPRKIELLQRDESTIYNGPLYDKKIIDLRLGIEYKNYYDYISCNNIGFDEYREQLIIQLIDAHEPQLIFNRHGRINSDLYPPKIMFKDDYENLPTNLKEEIDRIKDRKLVY